MSKTFSTGLRVVGVKPGVLFSKSIPSTIYKTCVANYIVGETGHIQGKTSRVEPMKKPKPWDYQRWGYSNLMALFIDRTWKRINDNSKVIVVEGMPAIGKSNLARALAEELEMKYFPMVSMDHYYVNKYGYDARVIDSKVPERLRSFCEGDFFKDPKNPKTLHMQFVLWVHKYLQYQDALAHLFNTGEGVVLDRCVYSDSVFLDALIEMGYIGKAGKEALRRMREYTDPMEEFMRPHLIVYLDAPVSVVEENLRRRGRGEEKVFNKELLSKIEHNYKFDYLKKITEHAELLAYDWSTPGEAEVIVEDIERIDFERFDHHDTKMEDWRLRDDCDYDEKRWYFTNDQGTQLNGILHTPVFGVPELKLSADDRYEYEEVWESVPGNKYLEGFNPDMGDSVLHKLGCKGRTWRDFDLEPLNKA